MNCTFEVIEHDAKFETPMMDHITFYRAAQISGKAGGKWPCNGCRTPKIIVPEVNDLPTCDLCGTCSSALHMPTGSFPNSAPPHVVEKRRCPYTYQHFDYFYTTTSIVNKSIVTIVNDTSMHSINKQKKTSCYRTSVGA